MSEEVFCPVCGKNQAQRFFRNDGFTYICKFCGNYYLSGSAKAGFQRRLQNSDYKVKARYFLTNRIESEALTEITTDKLDLIDEITIPGVEEQIENLITRIGSRTKPGESLNDETEILGFAIGTWGHDNLGLVIESAKAERDISQPNGAPLGTHLTLTRQGWRRYAEIMRGRVKGFNAFMAMSFHNEEVTLAFNGAFKPGAFEAGFDLRRVDEDPRAGLIDDNIRVQIRKSKFIVADLTDNNRGAYWEAGYAEGLGKPVIYTCEAKFFKEPGTHFDTRNHHTIIWSSGDLANAAKNLTATIRATLPFDSKLE